MLDCSGVLPLRWARGLMRRLTITCPLLIRGLAITYPLLRCSGVLPLRCARGLTRSLAITYPLLMRGLAITFPLLRAPLNSGT